MRKKELRLVVTFASTHNAMKMERVCRKNEVPGRLIPVPLQISAGCGLCFSAPPEAKQQVLDTMEQNELEPEQVLEMEI